VFSTEFRRLAGPKHQYFVEDCFSFLASYGERGLPKVGLYFYDADHAYESQMRALVGIEPYLSDDCAVLVDDINRTPVARANEDFFGARPEFRQVFAIETPCDGWPTWWDGLALYARTRSATRE
jgi:hypothetical protein